MSAGAAECVSRSALPKLYRTNKIEVTPVIDEWSATFRDQAKCRDDNKAFLADLITAPSRLGALSYTG